MKSVEEQLSQYKSVHFNKKNIQTHFVGVPLIIWAVTLLLSLNTYQISVSGYNMVYSAAYVFFAVTIVYYFMLHTRLAIAMVPYAIVNVYLASLVSPHEQALYIAIAVFVIGWIIQFIGHHFEKAKPAFVDDLGQFLIAPLFLMAEVCFMLGWLKPLEDEITPMAVTKRRALNKRLQEKLG
jgi:uncharacterized membrane protein YGL010W